MMSKPTWWVYGWWLRIRMARDDERGAGGVEAALITAGLLLIAIAVVAAISAAANTQIDRIQNPQP